MINWDEELEKIFADPLFADVTAPQKKVTSKTLRKWSDVNHTTQWEF